MRIGVAFGGAVQVAAQPPQLGQLVAGKGDGEGVHLGEFVADPRRLALGLFPLAAHFEQLRPVHPTDADEHHGTAEAGAPSLGGVGPLLRPAQVGEVVTEAHQLAVEIAGVRWSDASGDDGEHRLVESGETGGDLPCLDHRGALPGEGQRAQRVVTVANSDGVNLRGDFDGRDVLRRGELLVQLQPSQVPVGGAFGLLVEQPLGPAQPAGADRLVAAHEPIEAEPHRQHRRGGGVGIGAGEVAGVGLLGARQALLDLAQPPRRVGEGGEVRRRQLATFPSGEKAFSRLSPTVGGVGSAGCSQYVLGHFIHLHASPPLLMEDFTMQCSVPGKSSARPSAPNSLQTTRRVANERGGHDGPTPTPAHSPWSVADARP